MTPAASIDQVLQTVQEAKKGATAFCTNFFPVQSKLQSWIDHAELFVAREDGAVFLLRKDRDFYHLYYAASTPSALEVGLARLELLRQAPVVADVLAQEAALQMSVEPLLAAGFVPRSRLVRLTRPNLPVNGSEHPAAKVASAVPGETATILGMLGRCFDRYADQLPTAYELETAIRSGQVLCTRAEERVAAVLFFETQGLTSTIRFWVVDEVFKARRFGSELIRRYLGTQPAVRRFILWVRQTNEDALQKYGHYGYKPDGLADQILVNNLVSHE